MALPLPNFQELGRDIKNRLDTLETDVSTKISTADANATFLPIKGKAESAKIADSATTADKLTASSNFSISGGVTAAGVAYNGTADVQLVVTSIDGTKVTGTVPSATKATQDAAGNVIATTYAKQSQLPSVMGAASAAAAGKSGLVPQPAAGSNTKFLRGDATWQTVTDPTVTQSSTTTNGALPILIKNSATTTAETGPVKYATTVTVNPSTSTITATNFAGTASKAIADKSGNDITTTYAKQADLTSSTDRIDTIENTSIRLTGDVTGSATIGSTGSVSIAATIANSGVTAGTYGPTGNKTLVYGDTFTVPSVTVNAKGQTTAGATRTFTLPAAQDLSDYAKTADLPTTMVGATGSAGGKSGLVPASKAGDQNKVLSAGGTWVNQPTFTQQRVDWNASSGVTSIANKPTLGALAAKDSVAYSEVTGKPDLTVYHTVSAFNTFKSANDTALAAKANAADVYTKTEVDNKLASVYTYKGSVATEAKLPTSGQTVGDVYNIEDTGMNVAWTANGWDKLGSVVDLSPYAKSADVYSKSAADSKFLTQTNAASTYATQTTVTGVSNKVTALEGKAVTMTGAASNAAGKSGFVPQPAAGDQAKFLRGDGTWAVTPDTKYTAGAGIGISGTTITNAGVRSVTAGSTANQISVNTNGTTSTITVNNVAKATAADSATKATQDSAGQQINTTYIKGLAVSGKTITYTKGDGTTGTLTTQDTTYSTMTGATSSAAGKGGLVPAPTAGDQLKFLRADGTWVVPTDTKYTVMGSATASAGGKSGLVPASAAGDQLKFLRADGTWVVPTDTKYSAGTGVTLDGTTFSNAGVRSVTAGASANQITVNTGGTTSTITVNNVANATAATKATQDSAGQQINTTYIKDLSVSGQTITYTKGDGTTGTIKTQDNDTKYTAGTGLSLSGTTFTNAGVRSVKAGTSANQIVVDTNGTSNTITVNNVANATAASKLATARTITLAGDVSGTVSFDGSDNVTLTATVADDSHNHVIANVDGLQNALNAKAPLASPALTGTPTAPTAGTSTNSTQVATTAFVQAVVNEKIAASDAMIYKGTIGSTGATIKALPATHSVGWTYKVITAGTYAGKACEVGDMIICLTAGTTALDSDWTVVQSNIDGAVTGPASSVDAHVATFNGTTGKVIKDSGYTIASSVPANAKFTDTTYTAGTGIGISGTTINNAGVRSVTAGTSANQIAVNTGGTSTTITVNNVAKATAADSATKATQDSTGQQINTTYIKGLAASGKTITYTKGDGTTGTLTTQDTTYTAGTGIGISGTTINNAGVRSVKAGSTANVLAVDTNGTTSNITINNVANATNATKATQDASGNVITTTYAKLAGGNTFTGMQIINGITRDQYYASNVCREITSARPTEFVIKTKIVFMSSRYMPVVRLYGYAYGLQSPIELRIGFYVFDGQLGWCGAVSTGAWKPEVYLFKYTEGSTEYIAIGLKGECYYCGFQVDVQAGSKGTFDSVFNPEGWSTINNGADTSVALIPEVGTDGCVLVPYKTMKTDISGNAATASYAANDSVGQQINTTYIKGLSVNGKTITYTKGNGDTGTITTQDTTYTAGTGLSLSGTTFSNAGVRSVVAGTSANQLSVNTNGTTATITINNVANATTATKLGSATVGSTIKPMYLNAGTPTAFTSNVGGTAQPMYMASGELKALTASVGSATLPVYLKAGVITQCGTSLAVSITGTAAKATADASGNTITTTYAKLASPALTGTPTAPTAGTSTSSTQIATTAFVQAVVNEKIAASDAMIYKGTIGSTGATVTTLPATHSVGWTYKVITAGTYAGKVCEVGDMIICLTGGTAAKDSDWTVVQSNIDGAVTGPASSVDTHIAAFSGATGKVIKDSGYTIATSVPANAKFTDTTYTAGTGLSLSGTTFTNAGVRSVKVGTSANQIVVDTNGTSSTITVNNVANATAANSATKATQDSAGQQINKTYIKGLSVSGKTITYTKGDDTTGTITTQDTTYSAGVGLSLSGTTFSNSGVRSIAAGTTANQLSVNTNGTTSTITINNVANATKASSADKLTTARTITLGGDLSGSVSFDGSANVTLTATVADDSHNHTIANVDGLQTALDAKAPLASPTFTGTPKAPTAASGTNTTQIATTAFVQSEINSKIAAADAMIFKGTIGTGGTITALPNTHTTGWTYKVITAGTYAGQKCEVGDLITCLNDGTAASNADWTVIQTNIDGAVTGPTSSVANRIAVFDGTTGKIIKDSGYTIATSVPANAKFTDTTYTAGTGISISNNAITNTGVRGVKAGASANQIVVDTNGTSSTITVNNVAKATAADSATKATQDSAGQQINMTYIKGLSVSGKTITYTKGDGTTGTITTQDTNTTYAAAKYNTLGLVKPSKTYTAAATLTTAAASATTAPTIAAITTTAGRYYAVESDSNGVPFVNVPWQNTTYTAGTGISISSNAITNTGVRSVKAGSSANQISVNTNGTTSTITVNNVANATAATKATQDSAGQQINTTYIKGLAVSGQTITYTKGDGTTGTITTQDTKVTQTATTTNAWYPVLATNTADAAATVTDSTRFGKGVAVNPSTSTIKASNVAVGQSMITYNATTGCLEITV